MVGAGKRQEREKEMHRAAEPRVSRRKRALVRSRDRCCRSELVSVFLPLSYRISFYRRANTIGKQCFRKLPVSRCADVEFPNEETRLDGDVKECEEKGEARS